MYYCIILKQSSFKIISREVQGCTSTNFQQTCPTSPSSIVWILILLIHNDFCKRREFRIIVSCLIVIYAFGYCSKKLPKLSQQNIWSYDMNRKYSCTWLTPSHFTNSTNKCDAIKQNESEVEIFSSLPLCILY